MNSNNNQFSWPKSSGSTNAKKPKHHYKNDNLIESLRDMGSGVGRSMAKDVVGGIGQDALSSLFGTPRPTSGELQPNQPLEVNPERAPRPSLFQKKPEIDTAAIARRDQEMIAREVSAVRQELLALAKSIKALDSQISHAVAEAPVNPGVYHQNFFERLRSLLVLMRKKVDESSSWLAVSTAKSKKKMGYWGRYKKQGTKFGLSSERTLATQTG